MEYRLLRNNIEYGPFSLEELKAQHITESDLIWVEGRSASWKFWNEIPALVSEIPLDKQPKKKFRITADHQVVEITAEGEVPVQNFHTAIQTDPPKHSVFPLPKDTTFDEINRRVASEEQAKEAHLPHNDTAFNTIDEMAYNNTSGKKPSESNAGAFTLAGILFLIAIGWFGFRWYNDKNGNSIADGTANVADTGSSTLASSGVLKGASINAADDTIGRTERSLMAKTLRDSLESIRQQRMEQSANRQTLQNPNQEVIALDEEVPVAPVSQAHATKDSARKNVAAKPIATAAKIPVAAKPVPTTPTAKAKIDDFVRVSLTKTPEKGIKDLAMIVHNISDKNLNSIAVSIIYYDGNGDYLKGESLRFVNIAAGGKSSAKIPEMPNAATVSYKIASVSGEQVFIQNR